MCMFHLLEICIPMWMRNFYDTFSAFGVTMTNPKIKRDLETRNSCGFGFINYDTFEASDAAIKLMNGQYLYNRLISVLCLQGTNGERHGTTAERTLVAINPTTQKSRPPHTVCKQASYISQVRALSVRLFMRFHNTICFNMN
ncbi:putative RNA recognition motif domain, nucleotide-binding alpha-beta plait domain superfamily [Helianthus anomalus]